MIWRRLLILDFALFAVLVAGIIQVRSRWLEFQATHRVDAVQPDAEPVRTLSATPVAGVTTQDWTDISVKNPFSFDRNDIAIVAPTQAVAATPKPVLFGIMAVGSDKIALLSPGRSGRASRPTKTGESVDDNWKVVEIKDKSVIVVGGTGTREEIIMNDPTAQVARSIDRTGTGAPAGGNVVTATPSAPAPPTNTNTANSTPGTAPQTPAPAQPEDILMTPFGPVKRTKP